jgi:hypothetical protein
MINRAMLVDFLVHHGLCEPVLTDSSTMVGPVRYARSVYIRSHLQIYRS